MFAVDIGIGAAVSLFLEIPEGEHIKMRNSVYLSYGLLYLTIFIFLNCTPKVSITPSTETGSHEPRITVKNADTLSYIVEFADKNDRERFITTFSDFLKNYPFAAITEEAGKEYIKIKILPFAKVEDRGASVDSITMGRSSFVESIIERTVDAVQKDSLPISSDTIVPEYGGSVRIFAQRGGIDGTFAGLVNFYPFSIHENDTGAALVFTDSSQRRVVLKLTGKKLDGKGKVLSALDMIESWSKMIKAHPADGFALFRHVDGMEEFVNGKEALVRGFSAIDDRTIQIRFSKPDEYAVERMRTAGLLGVQFSLGPYYLSEQNTDGFTFLPNRYSSLRPFLDKIVLSNCNDPNPILSFSLNKYDAVILTSINDLEYSRRNLDKTAILTELSEDRYFISVKSTDQNLRNALSKMVNAADLLRNYAKAEGEPITAVTSLVADETVLSKNKQEVTGQIPFSGQIKILFRKDDPVSKAVAEKLFADMRRRGIGCVLAGSDYITYEKSLIVKDYGCAVGWVSQTALNDRNEQLRTAALWFDDVLDEQQRISEGAEIPLFTVKRYLLMKNDLHLFNNTIAGIFRKAERQIPNGQPTGTQ